MKDILNDIIAHKKVEVEQAKKARPLSSLVRSVEEGTFEVKSLKETLVSSPTGIISEFKRRSPSKGWIRQTADAVTIAKGYQDNGASALSVLTDEKFFGGTRQDLHAAAQAISIPILRKDFIIDEYQLYEAKLSGAHAVLLIASALSPTRCKRLTEVARDLELEVLLELHDEREIAYITPLNTLIGINNRNLGSFHTDVRKSFDMTRRLPSDAVWVSESGISSPATVKELRDAGYKGFLIGERFMKEDDPGASLGRFMKSIPA